MGVSQNQGCHFGGPYNKDYSILGSTLGSPYLGKLPYLVFSKSQDHFLRLSENGAVFGESAWLSRVLRSPAIPVTTGMGVVLSDPLHIPTVPLFLRVGV